MEMQQFHGHEMLLQTYYYALRLEIFACVQGKESSIVRIVFIPTGEGFL